ncbi:MAG: response regulator [Rubrobacter sp.]
MRQILANLVSNAVKFTESGEVVLKVESLGQQEDSVSLRFEISDTGIGTDANLSESMFQSFSQADASTTRRYGGTGLGLAISSQLVDLMGGDIGLVSEPDVGSTFWFELSFDCQTDVRQPGMLENLRDLAGLKVLIVDDNETNREILKHQISPWKMKAEGTQDGASALQALRSAADSGEPFDVAIVDMHMPGMDGLQLARAIKGDPRISASRLVMLTSLGDREEVAEIPDEASPNGSQIVSRVTSAEGARRAGISVYLSKPVKQSELYDALAAVVNEDLLRPETPSGKRLVTRHELQVIRPRLRVSVLVSEDNPVNQKVASKMLERLGYRAEVVRDGEQALEALENGRYAAILMDIQMPGMDGYAATAIRARERANEREKTPIIAMTANAMKGDREHALEAGMDDYISKPVRQSDLSNVLSKWISGNPSEPLPKTDVSSGLQIDLGRSDVLDERVIEGLLQLEDSDSPGLLEELIETFEADSRTRLAELREALMSRDDEGIERTAHALKSSSGNMGASRMSNVADEVQTSCVSGNLSDLESLVSALEREFEVASVALRLATKERTRA